MAYTQADLDALDVLILAARTQSFTVGPVAIDAKKRLETLLLQRAHVAEQLAQASTDSGFGFIQTGIKGIDT